MTTATTRPICQEKWIADAPASDSVSRISSGAYATEESASEANTGSAMRLGSSVSPSLSLRSARPIRMRFGRSAGIGTARNRKGSRWHSMPSGATLVETAFGGPASVSE